MGHDAGLTFPPGERAFRTFWAESFNERRPPGG